MVQLPVCPLPTRWYDFTSGHYIDEFAESHFKNMVVREVLGGAIPSAGVGCGFSRRALEAVAAAHGGDPFNTGSLTEDYEMGFRVHALGLKQAFVRAAVARPALRRRLGIGRPRTVVALDPIVVRAYFPTAFRAAVRQKARWVLGISLQGFRNIGWPGGGWTNYMLFRDRKSLFTSIANVVGYVSLAAVLGVWAAGEWLDGYRYPPLIAPGTWVYKLIVADTLFLALRVAQRSFCAWQFYGWRQAALAAPRQVWANFINFGAAARAIRLYAVSLATGRQVAWGKTAHQFPSALELQVGGRRLGELLLERRAVNVDQLEAQ
jgi:adsorption protein B